MDAMRIEATARERLGTRLAGAFGAFAVLLAGLGLAGVMAFILGERETEIGVRQALGADARMIVRMLTGEGLRVAILGVGVGLLAFLVAWPLVAHLFVGLQIPGAITFVTAIGLIIGVSGAAAYVPARRATRLDPVAVLRRG
jgi:putative ABC transport system permease protein